MRINPTKKLIQFFNQINSDHKSLLVLLAGALILALYTINAKSYDFIADDAFITFRYAENLAEGKGLVYNVGERVEGTTTMLWTFLLAFTHLLRIETLFAGRFLSFL